MVRRAELLELPFVVQSIRPASAVIAELWLAPIEEPVPYAAGQYVLLGPTDYRVEERAYSAARAPRPDGRIRLLVTREPEGETSGWVHDELREGEPVLISGPYGEFVLPAAGDRPFLGVAGGSGLAPILALAEEALGRDAAASVSILFSARTENDVLDRDLFTKWRARWPRFRFVRTLTREPGAAPPAGHVQDVLPGLFPDLSGHAVFTAGPPGLVEAVRRAARACGAPGTSIYDEPFFPEPRPT